MDAMKQALMKKMESMKSDGKSPLEIEINLGKDTEEDDKSDELAPELKGEGEDDSSAMIDPITGKPKDPMTSLGDEHGMDAQHMDLMKAIADGAPEGRAANGLREHAALGAKNKMAQMLKMKGKR